VRTPPSIFFFPSSSYSSFLISITLFLFRFGTSEKHFTMADASHQEQ